MKYTALTFVFLLNTLLIQAQFTSIHPEQSEYFHSLGKRSTRQYDSINGYKGRIPHTQGKALLQKRVFGYHPYWIGNAWQNYRWDLLSDLCYFSYETDPATGNPLTTNGFETAEVIDTALAHGVRVHLCVTLFSGHAGFFANPAAQQTLIGNILSLLSQRGATGVNIDFEAVPSSQQQNLTAFLLQLSEALHSSIPGSELSIAAPAVNWSNTFDIPAIAPALDFFMIMAYDYYWSGSTLAGPVSGLWPLTGSFNYAVDHSLSYYLGQGVPGDKILLGLPYYGREWPVNANTLPASTTGSGTALTYRTIRNNNGGYYTPENFCWDPYSNNPYYSYFSSNWRQCFFDDVRSLGSKYELVNRKNAGGIGIWALGYDDGYPELWDLIEHKFTQPQSYACQDTLYDTGGPWWSYGNSEAFTETITSEFPGPLSILLSELSLESGYDSLFVYDGADIQAPLLAAVSGQTTSDEITTTGNVFTIRFISDVSTTGSGYKLIWSCPTALTETIRPTGPGIGPVPASGVIQIRNLLIAEGPWVARLYNLSGQLLREAVFSDESPCYLDLKDNKPGLYILTLSGRQKTYTAKVMLVR